MRRPFDRWAAPMLLGAGGALAAVAALFSSGSSNGRLVWIGLAALAFAAAVGAGALVGLPRPVPGREALVALGVLAAFVVWNGVSVLWSIEPDRSWDYFNRGLVYLAFAVVGLALGAYLPRAPRFWALTLAGVIALALGWALLGKAFPGLLSQSGRTARLGSPIGYWNALALLFDLGLPLALWLAARREHPRWLRLAGALFVYGLTVGVLLTYSRGGVLVAVVAAAAWLALGSPRIESAVALLLGGATGAGVALWAFSRAGLSKDLQPHAVRVHDGAWFAVVFGLAGVAVCALAYLALLAEERWPLSERQRTLLGRTALAVLAVGAAAAVVGLAVKSKPQAWFHDFTRQPTNGFATSGPGRLANINSTSRWQWWKEAWKAFEDQPARGTGAGTFELTHRLLRNNNVVVTEPHSVPLQFLSETGIVGLLLALGSVAAAGVGVVRALRRLAGAERVAAVALAVAALAYVLHSLVDFDWDFVGVSAPFVLTVGVLLGGGVARIERRPFLAPVPVAIAVAVALSLLAPWYAQRATNSALAAIEAGRPVQALSDARDARSLNPLALEPLFVEAAAEEQLANYGAARRLYVRAVRLQPLNWRPWYELASFEFGRKHYQAALAPVLRSIELDRYGSLAPALLKQVEAQAR